MPVKMDLQAVRFVKQAGAAAKAGLLREFDARRVMQLLLTIGSQFSVSGTRFIATVLLARFAGAEDLGTYTLIFSFFLILASIESSLISGPYSVFLHQHDHRERKSLTGGTTIHLLVLSVFTAFLCSISMLYPFSSVPWENHHGVSGEQLRHFALLMLVSIPFMLARAFAREVMLANFDYYRLVVIDLVADGLFLAALVYLALKGELSSKTALICMGVSGCIAMAIWLHGYRKQMILSLVKAWADFRKHLNFGKWLVAGEIIVTAQTYVVVWILAATHGLVAVGILSACFAITNLLNPVILGLSGYFAPRMARTYAEQGVRQLRRQSLLVNAIILSLMAGFVLFIAVSGELLLGVLFDRADFSNQQSILLLVAIGALIVVFAFGAETSLWIREQNNFLFYASSAGFAASCVCGYLLIPQYGLIGAAATILIGRLVYAIACISIEEVAYRQARDKTRSKPGPGNAPTLVSG